jgi:multiple sugar transport system substrate-binding protein
MKRTACIVAALALIVGTAFAEGAPETSSKTELNFLEVMTNPARTEVLKGLIAAYEAKNPGVKINLISPPYEQADNKLTMMLNAQQPLDIVEVRDLTAAQYVNNKRLEDLSSYISSWTEAKSLLSITKEAASAVGGKPYLIPQFFYIKALFVRTDILAKYGVTKLPETMDELYATAKKITNPAKNQFGFTLRGKGNAYKSSDYMIISDIKGVDPQNFYRLKDGSSIYDRPEFLAGLKSYTDLYAKACPTDAINWGFNEQINAFVSGITPFLIQDPDAVPLVNEQLGADKYTVIPMPVGKSGTTYLDYGYAGYGIPSYSKNKDAAWKFIAYLSSAAQNAEFCKKYGALPIHTTSFEQDPYFSTGVYKAWATTMNTSGRFTFVKYPYASEKFPGWGQVQELSMQATLLGKTAPEEAVKQWSSYWK